MWILARSILLLGLVAAPSVAIPSYTEKIFVNMKAALEPEKQSARKLVFIVSPTHGEPAHWTARQVRKTLADGQRVLTVFLEPESVKGIAVMTWDRKEQRPVDFLYLAPVRRTLKNADLEAVQLLYSEFTFADVGAMKIGESQLTLLGAEQHIGKRTMKIQEVPRAPRPYTRVLTWVATDAPVPIDREFYDLTDTLIKTVHYDFTTISEVPTITHVKIENKVDGTSTEMQVADVRFDVDIPDSLFDPSRLGQVADDPFWQSLAVVPTPAPVAAPPPPAN